MSKLKTLNTSTDDPLDHQFLCPSLLLTQSNSYIVPELNYLGQYIPPNQRYKKKVQAMLQDWWKSWSFEYLKTLQERNKWSGECKYIEVNEIVLVSGETLLPSKWPLGRVVKAFKGPDDLARIVEVRICTSVLRRPIHKLILLKINNELNS